MCFQRTAICSPLIAASKTRIPFLSTWFCECLVASTPLYGTEISPTAKRHAKCFSLSGKVCIDVCSALIVNLAENAANNNRSHSCWLIDWAVTAKFISYLLGGQEKVKAGMGGGGCGEGMDEVRREDSKEGGGGNEMGKEGTGTRFSGSIRRPVYNHGKFDLNCLDWAKVYSSHWNWWIVIRSCFQRSFPT